MDNQRDKKSPPVDLLYGVAAIAGALSMSEAAVYHLHARKELPTFKIRGRVCARRSHLDAWLEEAAKGGRANG